MTRKIIICILVFGLINIFNLNISNAASLSTDINNFKAETSNAMDSSESLRKIANRFLGALRIISALLLVITLGTTGYKYIVATPDIKKEIKDRMLPLILGLILLFGATSISVFIISSFGG